MARFEKGNPGGPGGARPGAGRKPKEVREVEARLFAGISEEDLAAILGRAVEQAKAGDPAARAWIFERGFGKVPSPDVEAVQQDLAAENEAFQQAVLETFEAVGPDLRRRLQEQLENVHGEDVR